MIESNNNWTARALCVGKHDIFDVVTTEDALGCRDSVQKLNKMLDRAAQTICATCPVIRQCMEDAIGTEDHGVRRAGVTLRKKWDATEKKYEHIRRWLDYQEAQVIA